MRIVSRSLVAGGAAAFFFFSWILQLLWNSILFEQLQLVPTTLTYWQMAGLWFTVIILFGWTGFVARPRWRSSRKRSVDWCRLGDRIERTVKAHVGDWDEESFEQSKEAEIEAKIKRAFSRWVDVEGDLEWDDLGEHIERKIKRHLRDWLSES